MNAAVGHYGTFDFQRSRDGAGNTTFYSGYTPVSNFSVGAYLYSAGFSKSVVSFISNTFALFKSAVGDGPGGPTLLISDPDRYISSGFRSTSSRDRTIDFWMSEQELEALYSALHPAQNLTTSVGDLPILKRASESTHKNFMVLPKDVAKLRHECEIMAGASLDLRAGMQRVIRICDLAVTDHLGILVIGG